MKCERCKKETPGWKMSWFNTQKICLACDEEERKHPDYPAAKERILQEEANGNRDYEGVGLPKDLEKKYAQEEGVL